MEVKPPDFVLDDQDVFPQNWIVCPLGEIGQWFSGGTPRMSIEAYWTGDIPWVSPKDMKVSRLHDAIDHISPKAVADGAHLLPTGAVLMVIRGMILAHSFPVARAERALAFNQDMKAVVTRGDVDSNFVLYWLIGNAQRLRGLVTDSTHGTKRLPPEMLYRVPFPLPQLAEQKAIAEALSDADALIESLEQLLAKKRAVKQGTMQALLTGKKRLPGFTEKWSKTRLGKLGATYGGLTGKTKSDFARGTALYITFMNVMYNPIIDPTEFESVNIMPGEKQNRVCAGDLLFNGSSETPEEVGMCSLLLEKTSDVYLNSFCFGFRLVQDAPVDRRFLVYLLRSAEGRNRIYALAQGATRHNLSKTALMAVEFDFPSLNEQVALAEVFGDMDTELDTLEHKLAKARQIKQGMMQELLTGRIRLV